MIKRVFITVSTLLIFYGIFVVLLTQYSIRPSRTNYSISNIRFQKIIITNEDGYKLTGWASKTQHTKSVLLLHGIRSNAKAMLPRALFYLDSLQYNVLIMDQRAHGLSEGRISTAGANESKDIPLFVDFIKEKYRTSCGIHGISMGGAAALLSAEKTQPNFMVLEMVYPRLDRAIENRLTKRIGSLAKVVKESMYLIMKNRYRLNPKDITPIIHLKSYDNPLLIYAGKRDYRTTLEESQELYHAVQSDKKSFVTLDASHEDFYTVAPIQYEQELLNFLSK